MVLRGYPLTADGRIVQPSDFPGGIKGLIHADTQLGSGAWGWEQLSNATYDDWKLKHEQAQSSGIPLPSPPHIKVPGTEFTPKPRNRAPTQAKRKANADINDGEGPAKTATGGRGKRNRKKLKSKEVIEDSDSDTSRESKGDSDEETTSNHDSENSEG